VEAAVAARGLRSLATGLCLAAAGWLLLRGADPVPARPGARPVTIEDLVPSPTAYSFPKEAAFQGASSCAAAACHGGNGPRGSAGSEYSTWASHDPHARAYRVLFEDRSRRMVRLLRRLPADGKVRPDREALCLKCHALNTPVALEASLPEAVLADGVSCEACHGPAQRWKATHYQDEWRGRTLLQKAADGMFPTKDLGFRVQLCAGCHVGRAGMDVNHDLLAAGHPRLRFEYTAFHQVLPRHWRERAPDFEARAWAAGQVAALRASVALTEARAADAKAPWPELAEYSCYSCHHELRPEGWRQTLPSGGRRPGTMKWNTWYAALTPRLAEALPLEGARTPGDVSDAVAGLRQVMERPGAPRKAALEKAAACRQQLDAWLAALDGVPKEPLPPAKIAALRTRLLERPRSEADLAGWEWEQAVQQYLGAAALTHNLSGLRPVEPRLRRHFAATASKLLFPAGHDSPASFTPVAYLRELEKLRAALGGKE
jgi:hypothetical protein